MDVTDVLRARMDPPPGLQKMAAVSTLIHGAVLAIIVLLPGGLMPPPREESRTVMTISLGDGVPGAESGGLTRIGGRAVQAEKPPDAPRDAPRPLAARTPEMTVPVPTAKPTRLPPAPVKEGADDARGRTPTRGEEPRPGNALVETGARGQGFGLSTGGGAGTGSRLDITGDFCCPDYLVLMIERIRGNWNQRVDAVGEAVIVFTIQRDGRLTDILTEKSSGYSALDLNALRAVFYTRQLPALPEAFPNPTLTVHLNFQYRR